MKTKIILGSLLFMFTTSNSFSQMDAKGTDVEYAMTMVNKVDRNLTKKTIADASTTVDLKVKKGFDKNFIGATGLTWEIDGKNSYATFWKDELLHCALFRKNGNLLWSIVFLPQQKLPGDLMEMIKSDYLMKCTENYAVTFAANVKISNRNIWVVKLENQKEILTLRSEDDNLELFGIDKK